MKQAILLLPLFSFLVSWIGTLLMKSIAPRIGFVDSPGQRKIHREPIPLGGGVAIFWGIALPMLAGLAYARWFGPPASIDPAYWSGIRQQTPMALAILAAAAIMHVLGLWDDRKALGPFLKLGVQLLIISTLVVGLDMRVLTLLDHWLGMGRWPSVILTILWITAIANAFNFLDNMDGLSAGVAAVCSAAFFAAAILLHQWFVAAALALLVGSLLGFLCFNFPPASIFMGDSGSLVIGLLLGILTVRTTYLPKGVDWANGWYALFAPVIVLALPLYDLIVVMMIRLSRGKSPFVGDNNHFSHRLVARGMSRRTAVLCLYLISAATSTAAILLPFIHSLFAILIFGQTLLILGVVALLERHPLPPAKNDMPEAK